MNLLEYYKSQNKNNEWYEDHYSTGKGKHGKVFDYTTTNYRSLSSFITNFCTFNEVIGVPREEWPGSGNTKQEKHKQHVVNLVSAKLIYKKGNIFLLTKKGEKYLDFINKEFPYSESWLINYLFLSDAYFEKQINYIFWKVEDLISNYKTIFNEKQIEDIMSHFLYKIRNTQKIEDLVREDYFYLHHFYKDYDFLIIYNNSSNEEKQELHNYIIENIKNGQGCFLSHKYKNSGNYTISQLIDDFKVIYYTKQLINFKSTDYHSVVEKILNDYDRKIADVDYQSMLDYFSRNSKIFEPIFLNLFSPISSEEEVEEKQEIVEKEAEQEKQFDNAEERIDDTTSEGRAEVDRIFARRKKIVREQNDHQCELYEFSNCQYFTSKATNQNYVEIHHLIPREFRNDFEYSIEVIANYIPLCPNCHKKIHLATDRERKGMLNFLYNKRIGRLKNVKLNVELEDLYKYYNISD